MIKNMAAFNCPDQRSRASARDQYRRVHSSLAAGIKQLNRHIKKYVQNYALDIERVDVPGNGRVVGISEEWNENAAAARALNEETCMHIFQEDMVQFVDLDSFVAFSGQDTFIFGGGATPSFKLLRFLRAQPGVSEDAYGQFWQNAYAPAVATQNVIQDSCSAYIQNRALGPDEASLPLPPSMGQIAGVDEFWLEDPRTYGVIERSLLAVAGRLGANQVFSEHLVLGKRPVPTILTIRQ